MPYEIIIRKTETVFVTKKGEWTIVARLPWTNEQIDAKVLYQDADAFVRENPLREVYDYAPAREVIERRETELLKQTVDELDMAAVIRAINKL